MNIRKHCETRDSGITGQTCETPTKFITWFQRLKYSNSEFVEVRFKVLIISHTWEGRGNT